MEELNFENIESVSNIDTNEEYTLKEVEKPSKKKYNKKEAEKVTKPDTDMEITNCLRNERIIVRHVPKETGMVTNPKHVLYGGMAENAVRTFVVPRLASGMFVNILTDNEKAFLEEAMGLEYNALSIYKKNDNFWDDSNEEGISKVRLTKQDNYLDLSNPEDYIKYKILLANKDYIAPSLQVLQDSPKATYQFVLIKDGEEVKSAKDNMSNTMKCYKEYGKYENNLDVLKLIVETIEGKPLSDNVKIEFLQTRINNLIQADNKLFLKVITDPLLETKVMIKNCIREGLIYNRGNFLYLREGDIPMCEKNEDPTLTNAARYLVNPRHQEVKFALEAKLNIK